MTRGTFLAVTCAGLGALAGSGCSRGNSIVLEGVGITRSHIDHISHLTQLTLPAGTTGLNYMDFEGVDLALAARLVIPSAQRETFLTNAIFSKGTPAQPSVGFATGQSWWKPQSFSNRMDRTMLLSNGRSVELSFGESGSSLILLIACM